MLAAETFKKLKTCLQVTIAAVNGYALGGGCEISMCCDIRIAAEMTNLQQPEVNLGILPGFGGTQRLPRLIGNGRAKEHYLTTESDRMPRKLTASAWPTKYVPQEELLD